MSCRIQVGYRSHAVVSGGLNWKLKNRKCPQNFDSMHSLRVISNSWCCCTRLCPWSLHCGRYEKFQSKKKSTCQAGSVEVSFVHICPSVQMLLSKKDLAKTKTLEFYIYRVLLWLSYEFVGDLRPLYECYQKMSLIIFFGLYLNNLHKKNQRSSCKNIRMRRSHVRPVKTLRHAQCA